jgi:hypothetical protein
VGAQGAVKLTSLQKRAARREALRENRNLPKIRNEIPLNLRADLQREWRAVPGRSASYYQFGLFVMV